MTKTHTMRSRLISLVLVLVMVLGCLPLSALAADPTGLESEFQSNSVTYGDFTVSTRVADGYQLQTVGSQDSKQNVGMRMQIYYRDTATIITDGKLRIELYDEKGDCFRVVDVSGINYPDSTSGFSANTTATSYAVSFDDTGKRVYTPDSSAWAPKVTYNSDSIFVTGILVELTGSGSFPLKASLSNLGSSIDVGSAGIQTLGNFDIKAYSVDVPTVNLTYNLDATDAYYAYGTVVTAASADYELPGISPIRDHYTFVGWDSDDDEVANYQPGGIIEAKDLASDKLLTALWERDTLDVLFDSVMATGVTLEQAMTFTLNGEPVAYQITDVVDSRYLKVNMPYGTDVTFKLKLAAGYDPSTLAVVAGETLLAPINTQANDDGTTTYTYTFKATQAMTVGVRDDLAKYSYVVTMPVGHFDAALTAPTAGASTTVEYGGSYSFTVKAQEGYEITGVYVNGDELTANAGVYTVEDVKTAQNVEVLVKEIPNYTVTYVVNNTQYATQVVAKGSEITNMPKSPDVTGYDFEGWYTQGLTGGEGDKILTTTTVNGDMIVYAKLTAKTYTISYNGNGVTIDPSISSEKTYGEPVKLDATVLTRPGYTFLGWSRNQSATEATYAAGDVFTEAITEDITLYAVWKANTYTVTLPTGTGYTVVTTQENVVAWDEDFTFDVVVDRGYVENAPVVEVTDGSNKTTLTATQVTDNTDGSKTYSYKIENIQENKVVSVTVGKNQTYTVTFEVKGRVYQTQQVEYGYCATVPVAPEVMGYTFNGWKLNGTDYVFSTPVTDDITLVADLVWITNPVTLPVDGDGYSVYHEYTPSATNKLYDVGYNQNFAFKVVVKDGYSDANMFVVANGAPLYYNSKTYDETAKTTTYNYTLYNVKNPYEVFVNGVERKTVTITYIDNGGVGGPGQQVANYYVEGARDNTAVSDITPTRDGYTFQGWAKTNTATANDVVYKHDVDDKDTLQETTDTTLYAVWARAESKVELEVEPTTQFEGSEVTLTATVSSGGTGSVLFYRGTDATSTTGGTLVGTSNVSGDKATATVVVKDYAADAATDYFYAVFKPTDGAGYTETPSNVVSVTVKSTTIVFDTGDTADDPIVYQWVNGVKTVVTDGQMVVGETYHLQVPAIYAEDDLVNALDAETVTDIVWQYRLPNGEWQTIVTNDRVSIKVTPDVIGMEYRAILTPKGDYKGEALKTDETKPVLETETTVALTVAPTEQYEGKDVTLTAAVTTNETVIGEGFVQFYLNGEKIGQPVPVNTQSGVATMTWTTSAYSTAADATNKDVYYADYLGTATYDAGTSEEASVAVRSTAITWGDDGNILTLQDGTMTAGSTFTLALPAVTTLDGKGTAAYTVQWQEKKAGQDWQNVGAGGETYTVTEFVAGTVYRAVLTPVDPYNKAVQDATTVSYTDTLVTADSDEVTEVDTETGITLYQNNQELDNVERVLEGSTVDVVVNVTKIDQYVGGTQGWVKLEVFRKDADYTTRVDVTSATAQVDNAGNAYFTVELPAYSYDAVNSNQINFVATFSGDNTFADSVSGGAGTNNIKLKSAAITWADENGAFAKDVIVYAGTDTTAEPVTGMEANKAYTLVLPDVYAGDVTIGDHGVRMGEKLTFGKDYTVQWQRQEVGSTTTTGWQDIDGATEASLYVAAEDGAQKYSYRAVVTPKGDYSLAMDVTFGQLTETKVLTTNPTADTVLAETETTLEISNYYTTGANGANDVVAVYPAGRDVVLTATVTADSGKPTGTVTFYYSLNGAPATVIGKAEVNEQTGKATYTWKAPETATSSGIVYAVYDGSEVFETSETQKTDSNVAFLPNTIKMVDDGFQIYDKNGNVVDEPVVEETYILKGAYATVNTDNYQNIVDLVNDEQAKGDNPYFTYIWQKSTDSGKTWTDITNSDGKSELEVVFETDETMYRLAAKPVPASGWTGPENGVYSKGLGVDTKATAIEITLTDEAGVEIPNKANRFENTEVNVTVNVSGVKDYQPGTQGYVQLEVVRRHEGGADATVVGTQVSDVDQYGNATFKVTLPAYSYDPANGLSNQVNFKATYSGDNHFTGSELNVGESFVYLKSAAITWNNAMDQAIAITDDQGNEVTTMVANKTYTLTLPEIYSGDVYNSSGTRNGTKLVVNKDYKVTWQFRPMGDATAEWRTLTADSADTCIVVCDEGQENYSYRAVITPMGDYTFAMDETFGMLTATKTLTTDPTADTVLAATTTELVITDTVIEAGTVEIAVNDRADQPFEAIGEHHSEYEGETITLTATVSNVDGKVNDGNVFFYRYVDGTNDVLLNEVGVKVDTNGVAKLENVVTSDWTDGKSVTDNRDQYYAVYEGTSVFDASTSINELETVYIRSTAIATPRFSVVYEGAEGTVTKYVSAYADTDNLPAATTMTFTLMDKAGSKNLGFSVTGTDGRWLTNGTDYSVQWYREEKTVDQGGVETGVVKPIEAATQVSYEKEASSLYQKYSLEAVAMGHMKTSAMSKQAIIGTTAEPVLDLDPGYTFEPTAADVYTDVTTTPGAHYGDQVTLTATIQGDETTNALPTGTVTFYYRTSDGAWTALSEPINLAQKDVSENNLVAVATYTFNSSVLPFNVDRIGYSYSGDDLYTAHEATAMQNGETSAANAKLPFKLWSVQISNPGYEDVTDFSNPVYTDAACYPDKTAYDDVTITVYNATVTNDGKTVTIGAEVANGEDVQAQSYYVLELDDVYTKSGEKLELAKDNSADITVEWYQSFDDGKTWSPVRVTEFTDATATQVCVKAEDSHVVYGVKVITTNSFYNSQMPELVDYGYSHENIDVVRQHVNVSVEADAATPVAGTPEWVYQRNPITLTATVTPTDQGEPSGFVKFEYAVVSALDLDENGNPKVTDDLVWTEVVSDDENPTSKAELKPVDGTAYTDNTMVAELTTSNLPVTEDGTYSVILIKATYQGDDAYAVSDNIDGNSSIIASPVVRVFSSVALQDKTNIENQVVTLGKNDEGVVTWSNGSASGTAYDGFLITGKDLVSDGTQTGIVLTDVYTLDVMDRTLDLFKDKADIYTMKLNVDYTVEWQYIENYQAYQDYVNGTDEGKNWQVVPNSTSTDTCAIDQVQGYAFRAKITMLDTAKAKAAYEEFDNYGTTAVDGERVIYSNILVVGDAEARVLTNIRKASSASVKGDTVYIDAIIMGGTTTPVGNVTVTVTEKKSGEEVFSDNRNLVNGWTTFQWTDVQAGEYTIKTVLTGNNGYVGETEQDYIVRFTAAPEGDLTMSVTNKTVTYDGQVKMLSGNDVTINGFGDYTEWAEMAKSYVTFQYYKDGVRVAEPVDAGTYTVKAYLPESMYWGYVTGTGTLTIEKRAVSIADVTAQAKIFDNTNNVYVQNVELAQSAQDATTGLPTGNTGLVEGDSVYVDAKATVAANAGEQLLTVTEATLMGPDANNYALNTTYSEKFVVSRNQLYGDAVESITAAPGYQITDEDFYMIDQAGKQITAADATITYYYHTGNDIQKVTNTNGEGKYTVVISMPENNYKGGLTTTLYIQKDVATSRDGDVVKIATSALAYITDTNHVYDGTEKSVTVTTTKGTATVEYAGADGTYSTNKPVNAGRYMVKVTVEGQTYYGVMTIVKGEPQFTFTAETVDYDGDRYNGSLNLVETTGYDVLNADPTYGDLYYTYVGGSIVGYDYNAPRDVSYTVDTYVDSETSGAYGAYMVTAHVPETANTIAVTPSATFEINKIELQVIGDDIYTRLFDTHSKLTSTYDGFVGDEYGLDSELRDLIALPTYQLGDNELLSNEDMSHVGYLEIYQSDVNARNYTLKYVNGDAAINVAPTQDQLEIRNDPSTIYYGDNFQLFLYGSSVRDGDNVVQVNEASAVYWESDHPEIATVDEEGNVNIIGVGQFTITATRGDDPDTAISISETYTALKRRNDVVIERDDYLYDGQAKEIADANFSFYYMYHGTRFESLNPLSKDHCTIVGEPQTIAGEYPVTVTAINAGMNCGDGAGLLAIHRVNSVVTPEQVEATYGESFPGTGYTATTVNGEPVSKVLDKGLVEADVRSNSDVDNYELLVAAGTEGWNYNVTYAPYESGDSHDFTVTKKTLTFTVGSLADTEGMTKNWREKDGTLAGTFKELPDADFMQNDIRTFGELNQVLDYQTSDLITGDSIADLWDMSSRANANFAKLNDAYPFSVEGAANWKLNKTGEINYEYGTLDHEPMEGAIDDAAYIIFGYTDSRNYAVTIATGRLDVEQRVVKMTVPTSGIVINGGEYTSEELAEAIANQMVIEGLAEKLDHIIKDLRLTVVEVTGSQTIAGGNKTYTLKIGNTNYCTEGGGDTIEVPVTVTNITAKATIYNSGATGFKVRIYGMFDGQTRPEHINELKYTILDRNTGAVVRTGTMTYVEDETVNGILQAVYETSYAQLPNGNYTIRFEAAGYSFSY